MEGEIADATCNVQRALAMAEPEGHTVPSRILKKYPKNFREAKELGLIRD